MFKSILVPVDGSPTSDLALQEAINLAKDQRATLRIIHVLDMAMLLSNLEFAGLSELEVVLREAAQNVLTKAGTAAREAGCEPEVRLLEVQTPGERITGAIAEEAARWPADLIVIGTHGRRGLHHLLMGSVAEGVVRVSPKPVLLVRAQERQPLIL